MTTRAVFFVSDRTGITAEALGSSVLAQFSGVALTRHTLRFIDTPAKAEEAARRIRAARAETDAEPLIFSTLIDPAIRSAVVQSGGILFDLVDTFIHPLEQVLGEKSSHTVGQTHGIRDVRAYGLRIDAVNFALATDDGLTSRNHTQSDVIVLGVSRSGKTPTCLYLALTFGIHAANVPLTEETLGTGILPPELEAHRAKLFGLTIDASRLQAVRSERRPDSPYASLQTCREEVRRAEQLFHQERIPFLSTTAISIEEIATSIIDMMGLERRIG
ncbi:MAG: posphoenolpyruvate synthetase regulatory kinase/phosphorylase PpsR [Acidiferrobacteraceae bacterium]